jgi:NTP pyrophosphatase (non-canonical NTP hydrolase)
MLTINEIAAKHSAWVERMGWHNKTVLESLALIASEVGEAVNECRGYTPTAEFGTELADIILRTLDLAHTQGIDLDTVLTAKMQLNEHRGTRGRVI